MFSINLKRHLPTYTIWILLALVVFIILVAIFWGKKVSFFGNVVTIEGTKSYQESRPPDVDIGKIKVTGQIKIEGEKNHMGVIVGIIPASYMAITESDGKYQLRINKEKGESYKVIAIYNGKPYLSELNYDQSLENLIFNHTFRKNANQ